MRLIINGDSKVFDQNELNISQLLVLEKVEQPDMVSVQYNEAFLRQNEYESTALKENDEINFLYFMGGGK
ncbi:thiamine biosynthesis protein ThiS [Campylobacterota bacterium]|nr:thiamine biosynthesis protein ThiS [Campylobacterota bacterium]